MQKFSSPISPTAALGSWKGRCTATVPELQRAWAHCSHPWAAFVGCRHAGAWARLQTCQSDGSSAGHLQVSQESLWIYLEGREREAGVGGARGSRLQISELRPFPLPSQSPESPKCPRPLPLSQHPQPLSCSVPKHLGFRSFRTANASESLLCSWSFSTQLTQ